MRSQIIRARNLPEQNGVIHRIRVKPMGILCVMLVLGVLMLFMKPYLLVAGLTMILLALFALFVMPDRILCEFTSSYLVLYNQRDRSRCSMIYWEDIVSWSYEWHPTTDQLNITLTDGSTETQEMYSMFRIYRYMQQYAPGKLRKNTGVNKTRI